MKRSRPTHSQQTLFDNLRSYLTTEVVIYRPALMVGSTGVGKTWLAKYIVADLDGTYLNIATDHLGELLQHTTLPKLTPEDVAGLVDKHSRQQSKGPVFVDGLDAILTAIVASQGANVLVNFFTTMRRTRDLPYPTVLIVQLNPHVTEAVLQQSDWWRDCDCHVLSLTRGDRLIIAENWQVVPAIAERASTAFEIVLSSAVQGGSP